MRQILNFSAWAAGIGLAMTVQAGSIGYCVVDGGAACVSGAAATGAAGAITSTGNTPVALSGLAAGNLAGLNVLWILNSNNGTPGTVVINNTAAIANFVSNGGVLSFHDRNVNQGGVSAAGYVPGAAGVTFTSFLNANIDIVTPGTPVTNGAFGTITNTTLDGGNFSNHGFAALGTLPAGAIPIFSDGNATEIVDFWYHLGAGAVYYSSIPLDFYLTGGGNNPPGNAFRTIYGPNEVAFQASLGVPEPGSIILLSSGLVALGFVRRRLAK
jgi:hypothetical protein